MEKEPSANFWGVLIIFHEVIKIQSVEFDVSDIVPANEYSIAPHKNLWFLKFQMMKTVSQRKWRLLQECRPKFPCELCYVVLGYF